MKNIAVKSLENEAKEINKLLKKIQEAKSGTYILKGKDIERAIILSNLDNTELITNKVISIGLVNNDYIIAIDEIDNGIRYL